MEKPAAAVLSAVLTQILISSGTQAVQINLHPQDQYVSVGDDAYFPCGYTGTRSFPYWIINGRGLYTVQTLPSRHYYYDQTLTIYNVQASDNLTTYQCAFKSIDSQLATLFVVAEQPNTEYSNEVTSELVSTVTTMEASSGTVTTTNNISVHSTVNENNRRNNMLLLRGNNTLLWENNSITIIITAVIGSVLVVIAMIIIVLVIIIATIYCKKQRKSVVQDERVYEEVKDIQGLSKIIPTVLLEDNPSYVCKPGSEYYTLEKKIGIDPIYAEIEEKLRSTPNDNMPSHLIVAKSSDKAQESQLTSTGHVYVSNQMSMNHVSAESPTTPSPPLARETVAAE